MAGERVELEDLAARPSVAVDAGFALEAVYQNDLDQPMGVRLIHRESGFVLDLVSIESLPQGFIWVRTPPTSDRGEPHTQEHLLLGKGNVGRAVAGDELMTLTHSSAFTDQLRTCYHFNTAGGAEAFFEILGKQLDALIHPDYTDEEIRREVSNFGVIEDSDGSLRLEEQGTVYQEMVSSSDNPWSRLFRKLGVLLYGAHHPLALDAGGWPAAIREMKPEHIRSFHDANYRLGNMGMVASLPDGMHPAATLGRFDALLRSLSGKDERVGKPPTAELPEPKPAPEGAVSVVPFPHHDAQQPGLVILAWPPTRELAPGEQLLADLFLSALASDPTSNLYKVFVAGGTREMDLGATGVFGWVSEDQGHAVMIGLSDVAASHVTEPELIAVRARVRKELETIASYRAGSPELAELRERVRGRVIETRRALRKFVNSPPGFGFRGSGSEWLEHLELLDRTGRTRRSVTMKPELQWVEETLARDDNPWATYLKRWGLLDVAPYVVGARADPALLERETEEGVERIAAGAERLRVAYGLADAQQAIARYRSEFEAATAALEALEQATKLPPLSSTVPLTLDPELVFDVREARPGVPLVVATFQNMTGATTGLYLSLAGVDEESIRDLAILPELLTGVGAIGEKGPISYEEMSERMRREILGLDARYSTDIRTGRAELALLGSGGTAEEALAAIGWMQLVLEHPDLRPENLARIRDVVAQQLAGLRNTMQGAEESWVNDPARAYLAQDRPLLLATASFLTRMHAVARLRWELMDGGQQSDAVAAFLDRLAPLAGEAGRVELATLLARLRGETADAALPPALDRVVTSLDGLPPEARSLVREAALDLDHLLEESPDAALAADWSYLAGQMKRDLLTPPATALRRIDALRGRIRAGAHARMFLVGSPTTQAALADTVTGLAASVEGAKQPAAGPAVHVAPGAILKRLLERDPDAVDVVFVGLVDPRMKGGVFLNSAPAIGYGDTDPASLDRHLASLLFSGYGAHGLFMKTWGAGLAYSNGIRGSVADGRIAYYAERTPELPQTMRFVIDVLKDGPRDPDLVKYAVAQTFQQNRAAGSYEDRAEEMAADLADGVTPDVVRSFRQAVLAHWQSPGLADRLFALMPEVYGRVLPGYGPKSKTVAGGVFFVIGPEAQLRLYEQYLREVEGEDARLHRLWPRDFWLIPAVR